MTESARDQGFVGGPILFRNNYGCFPIAVFAVVFFLTLCVIWTVVVLDPRRRVPDYLQVSKVLYEKEESWGFGGGGNETGLLVYEMPANVATAIADKGLQFLISNDAALIKRQDAEPFRWAPTPVVPDFGWNKPEGRAPSIEMFLKRYGFGLEFDRSILGEVDRVINTTGNFYSYGRGGNLLVVSPALRKVILAYSG